MSPRLLESLDGAVTARTGTPAGPFTAEPRGGGCIHRAFVLRGSRSSFFVKVNSRPHLAMFEAEAEALAAIAATGTIRVPAVTAIGDDAEQFSYLVLEHLALRPGSPEEFATLGRQLAALHRHAPPDKSFGWPADNFIGSTPQENSALPDWARFWRRRRLEPQLRLAASRGARLPDAETLLEGIEELLANHHPAPALLHGDLWSGNVSFLGDGSPVLYDPASYFGDRETDLAFAELFGGFPPSFFEAYDSVWARPSGWEARREVYNLYHILNHLNLFGGGYERQALNGMERILRTLG